VANRDVAVVAVVLTAATAAQSKFTLKVHTGKGQIGYDVNSTMIIGERDILLIDPQFSLSEAHKLAAEILETGKHLATIYSTHPHPDHLFGWRCSSRRSRTRRSSRCRPPSTRRRRDGRHGRILGRHLRQQHPGPEPVLPEELATPVLTLEGEEFPITGGVQGADGPATASSGCRRSRRCHRRHRLRPRLLRRAAPRAARQLAEDHRSDRGAQPGDRRARARRPGARATCASIEWMKKYMADWDANVPKSKDAAEMRANVLRQYPGLGMEFTLNDRIATYFPAQPSPGK
jgi:hypothetical protein